MYDIVGHAKLRYRRSLPTIRRIVIIQYRGFALRYRRFDLQCRRSGRIKMSELGLQERAVEWLGQRIERFAISNCML